MEKMRCFIESLCNEVYMIVILWSGSQERWRYLMIPINEVGWAMQEFLLIVVYHW